MITVLDTPEGYIAKNMSCGAAERFASYLARHTCAYEITGGDELWCCNVRFHYKKGVDWIDNYNAGRKFCPFCGGVPELRHKTECGGHGVFYDIPKMVCTECGASVSGEHEQDTIDKWNTRFN